MFPWLRVGLAVALSGGLALHGLKKNSLDISGAFAAVFVGFCSFAISYRFGLLLIAFYYSSSKLTKVKEDVKKRLEGDFKEGGQRNWIQVFANSILATAVCLYFYFHCGEDVHVSFAPIHQSADSPFRWTQWINSLFTVHLCSSLWVTYVSHYACAAGDTWASELGILSTTKPRLVTTLFIREVPHGTNGGMSLLGTVASAAGGAFIGLVFWLLSSTLSHPAAHSQFPMVVVGLLAGLIGSLLDSLMGATLQASYYSRERKCVAKRKDMAHDKSVFCVSGVDLLSNEGVNFWSVFLTMVVMIPIAPKVFCVLDSQQCM